MIIFMRNVLVILSIFITLPALGAKQPLRVVESHHYKIHTNLGNRQVQPFAVHMDEIFKDYSQKFSDFRSHGQAPDKMNLFLLATRSQYRKFMSEHNIK